LLKIHKGNLGNGKSMIVSGWGNMNKLGKRKIFQNNEGNAKNLPLESKGHS
jgi:hypothetical protein